MAAGRVEGRTTTARKLTALLPSARAPSLHPPLSLSPQQVDFVTKNKGDPLHLAAEPKQDIYIYAAQEAVIYVDTKARSPRRARVVGAGGVGERLMPRLVRPGGGLLPPLTAAFPFPPSLFSYSRRPLLQCKGVRVDSCRDLILFVDSALSGIEIVNSKKIKVQVRAVCVVCAGMCVSSTCATGHKVGATHAVQLRSEQASRRGSSGATLSPHYAHSLAPHSPRPHSPPHRHAPFSLHYAQVIKSVPSIAIDKTDGILVGVPFACRGAQFVTSKSSEMNVTFPTSDKEDADWVRPGAGGRAGG
jgi:hypothetical protein